MTRGDKKEKKSGAHGAMVHITHRRGSVATPHLFCPVEDGSNPGGDRDAPSNPNPPYLGARERERESEREREGRAQLERNREVQQESMSRGEQERMRGRE